MSYAITPLNTVQVLDPLIDINNVREYAILRGGSEVSFKQVSSTSLSNSSCSITAPPPSPSTLVDRKVFLKLRAELTFTGTSAGSSNLLQSGYDALRSYPISSILDVLTVRINDTAVSVNWNDVQTALLKYNNNELNREQDYSMVPTYQDQASSYNDLVNTIRNPLGQYGETPDGSIMGRGGFAPVSFTNTPTSAVLVYDLCEPLFLSPFIFGHGNESAFVGVQTLDFNFSWVSDLTRIWSHATASGNTISSISVNLQSASLLFKYISLPETMSIPKSVSYPYFVINRYPTSVSSAFSALEQRTVSSQNIQLNSIPRRIYIYARKSNSSLSYTDPDVFLGIEGISLNWNNRAGLLSGATKQQLYQISLKNGCNMSWAQWSGERTPFFSGSSNSSFATVGSVVCLSFAQDVGLMDTEAPGINGTYQLQIDVQLKNYWASSVAPTLYIVVISEGSCTLTENRLITQIGVISRENVLDAQQSPMIDYQDAQKVVGSGSFFGDLKSAFGKIFREIKDKKIVSNVLKAIPHPYAQTAAPIAEALGLGSYVGGAPVGGYRRRKLRGGCSEFDCPCEGGCDECMGCQIECPKGGKIMSRQELRKRLKL